jgi:transposase
MVAYLTRVTDKTQVTRLMGISWRTVGEVVERAVARKQDPERLSNLRWIGVDEFSHRKGQRYLTLVVDHVKRRVAWTHRTFNPPRATNGRLAGGPPRPTSASSIS